MKNIFTDYIRTEYITFRHARGSSIESGKEFHTYHEIILFLEGDVQLITEDIHICLQPNSLIAIPRETYHQVLIRKKPENYYRCTLTFSDIPTLHDLLCTSMDRLTIYEADRTIRYLFQKLMDHAGHAAAPELLQAVLTLLLSEIADKQDIARPEFAQHVAIRNAISYINSNMDQKLTIAEIARSCAVSPSSLSHLFKKEMNISLHQFIMKKRLICAYHRISAGELATTVAMECGFGDYSGFYKQYRKMFGFSPSQKRLS